MKAHAAFLSTPTRSWQDRPDQHSISLRKFAYGAFTRFAGEIRVLQQTAIIPANTRTIPSRVFLQPVLSTTAQISGQSESILIRRFQPLVGLVALPPGHGVNCLLPTKSV